MADDREMVELVELVDETAPARSEAHAVMTDRIRANAGSDDRVGLVCWTADDPMSRVQEWVQSRTGRPLGAMPTWMRFFRTDVMRGALFVLHAPHPGGEATLVVLADCGVINRPILRAAARWAFQVGGLNRVAIRIPAASVEMQDYARRGGFKFEGIAYGAEPDGSNTALWAMRSAECPWLPQASVPIATSDTSPPSSIRMH